MLGREEGESNSGLTDLILTITRVKIEDEYLMEGRSDALESLH